MPTHGAVLAIAAAMSCQRWLARWRASMAAVFLSFLLDKKGRKNQGRHHRSQRTKRALPRYFGRTRTPNPLKYRHSHSQHLRFPAGMEVYIEWPAAASNNYDPETLQTAAWYLITITPFPKGISQHYTPAPYRHCEEEQACHERSAVEAIHL